jgi:hypothetical protein
MPLTTYRPEVPQADEAALGDRPEPRAIKLRGP